MTKPKQTFQFYKDLKYTRTNSCVLVEHLPTESVASGETMEDAFETLLYFMEDAHELVCKVENNLAFHVRKQCEALEKVEWEDD